MASTRELSPSVLLSLTENALKRVEVGIRNAVLSRAAERRSRTAEPIIEQKRPSRVGALTAPEFKQRPLMVRQYSPKQFSGLCIETKVDVSRPSSAVFTNLRSMEGLVRPHSVPPELKGALRPERASIMDRLNVKLLERHTRKPKRLMQGNRGEKKDVSLAEVESLIADLKLRVHQSKLTKARKNRDDQYTNTKQMLTEFSGFGSKIRMQRMTRRISSGDSSTKELTGLIELVDAKLSTTESLSLLKEIGIDYEPRTAAGKKNAMATGFSAALGANGLKISAGADSMPEDSDTLDY